MSGLNYGNFAGHNNMTSYDVVTVSYQNAATIKRYLSHTRFDKNAVQLMVVDNGSRDGTVEQLQATLSAHQMRLNKDNLGYAKAANQGAASGHQAFIVFINPDCYAETGTIDRLVEYLQDHPDIGVVGCRVLNQDGTLQAASCRRLPTFWRVFNHVTGLNRLGLPGINKAAKCANKSTAVEAVNGAFFVIRRDLFEQLKGFDEGYPLHFEDLDLFARCLSAGYQIYYLANQQAIHLQGQSKQRQDLIKQWKKQGLKRYFQKHRPRWEQWIINRLLV
ncbi:MAG: glycosyltransferase family 2 protein [Proteobacteria bacterium]|nr:MAG: glycosyltransferase family 2 protein [Pseudomonadota bacterium]